MFILTIISLSQFAYAEWVEYGQRSNGDILFFSTEQQIFSGQEAEITILANFKNARNDKSRSGSARVKLHCKEKKYQYKNFIYFSDLMAGGDVIKKVQNSQLSWKHPDRGTPYQTLFEAICK